MQFHVEVPALPGLDAAFTIFCVACLAPAHAMQLVLVSAVGFIGQHLLLLVLLLLLLFLVLFWWKGC